MLYNQGGNKMGKIEAPYAMQNFVREKIAKMKVRNYRRIFVTTDKMFAIH